MTIDQLREMLHAAPFRPFRIHMADGRHVDVLHPEFVGRSPSGRTIMVAGANDAFQVIDLLLVTSLEPIKNSSNRKRRGRTS